MNYRGHQFSHYHLIRCIGRGGFADVYEARDIHLDRRVAIKIMHPLAQHDHSAFLREARMLARMDHPHIIRVMEFDIHNNIPFLVMTYAPNGSLRQWHPPGQRLALDTIINYVWQIADALSYLHEWCLVHQDIKPDNLLLGAKNEILLADFGIAELRHHLQPRKKQRLVGTAAYVAPERLYDRAQPASDQYSLAVLVYEWLTGKNLFSGSTGNILYQHLHTPVSTKRMDALGVSPAVQRVLVKALAKKPEQRFKTVQGFALALERAGTPVVIPAPLTRWISRIMCLLF
jgi:serine/threonine protein kinase